MKRPHTKFILIVAASMFPLLGQAQTIDGQGNGERFVKQMQQRFTSADKDGDGHLTLAEAQGGMPRVATRFDAIDSGAKGYVTFDELRAYYSQKRRSPGSSSN